MIVLRDSVVVDAPPDVVWEWLETLPDHYRDWHPDHIEARWLRGERFVPGAVMETDEVLHGQPHHLRLTCVDVEPGRRVRYRMAPGLGGQFEVEPCGKGSRFTATITVGTRARAVGRAVDAVLTRALRRRLEAIAHHQVEEGANLKALLERRRSA